MNTTQRTGIMQCWRIVQEELIPELRNEIGALTPKLTQVIHTLEWVRVEAFVSRIWGYSGRPEYDRGMLANAFVAKAVLGISTTAGLMARQLRRVRSRPRELKPQSLLLTSQKSVAVPTKMKSAR